MNQHGTDQGIRQRIEALVVEVGDENDEYGMTRLSLEREGRFVLEHAGGHEQRRREPISGDARELLEEPIAEVFERAESIGWKRSFPPRPGIPNEAIVEWRVRTDKGEEIARMWLRDVEKEEQVAPLFASMRTVVDKASGGELFL